VSNLAVIRWPAPRRRSLPRSTLKDAGRRHRGIGLALEVVDGGFMDQVNVSNLAMTGIQTPLFIRLGNRKGSGTLKNVVISGITATDETMLHSSITGVPGSYVENVIVKDLIFNSKGTGTLAEANAAVPKSRPPIRRRTSSLATACPPTGCMSGTSAIWCWRTSCSTSARPMPAAVVLDDCHDIRLRNFAAAAPTGDQPLLRVRRPPTSPSPVINRSLRSPVSWCGGRSHQRHQADGKRFLRVREVVKFGDGGKAAAVRLLTNFE